MTGGYILYNQNKMSRIEKISTEIDNIDYIKEWEWKSIGGKLGVYFPKNRSHAGTGFMRKMKKWDFLYTMLT